MIADAHARIRSTVADYLDQVETGARPTGKYERQLVARWRADQEHAAARGWYFDEQRALRACYWFAHNLKHVRGELTGQPFWLSPYQMFLTYQLFGWISAGDKTRRFNRLYLSIGAGNGKTVYLAGLILAVFFREWEKHRMCNFFATAPSRGQAAILFDTAVAMCRANRSLDRMVTIRESGQNPEIYHRASQATLRIASPRANIAGYDVAVMSLDEIHEWRTDQQLNFYGELRSRQRSALDGLCLAITTAGDPSGASPLWETEETFCEQVLDAPPEDPVDDQYLGAIFRMDRGDDLYAEEPLHKANPNLPYGSPKLANLQVLQREAKFRPDTRHSLLRRHLNYPTANEGSLIDDPESWHAAGIEQPRDMPTEAYVGLDLGEKYDWAAVTAALALPEPHEYLLVSRSYTCRNNPHMAVDREPYRTFQERGHLVVHEGDAIDFAETWTDILAFLAPYKVLAFNFDESNARVIVQEAAKVLNLEPQHFPQNHARYNEPTKQFCDRVKKGTLKHLKEDTCLTYQVLNMTIARHPASGHWQPRKIHRRRKVDAGVAGIMALAGAMFHEREIHNYYETNAVIAL